MSTNKLPFYRLRSVLGYDYLMYYFLIGGRMAGKSYAVLDFYLHQWKEYGRVFYWLRLTDGAAKKLLNNKAAKLVDPDLRRRYGLNLTTNGESVYHINEDGEKVLVCKVLGLNTFYSDKGNGYYDKDYLKQEGAYLNICLDEMNREMTEKNSFDIVYAFSQEIENLVRNSKYNIRIICIGNTLEEASDIMTAINFLPEKFGRFILVKNKRTLIKMIKDYKHAKTDKEIQAVHEKYKGIDFGKRAIVEYMEPSENYKAMRNGSAAEILAGDASTFTNEIKIDISLINRRRLQKPQAIIKFAKHKSKWFVEWDGGVITKYNGQTAPTLAMRPYIDEFFSQEIQMQIINLFDTRSFTYKDLATFKMFQKEIQLLKPRK